MFYYYLGFEIWIFNMIYKLTIFAMLMQLNGLLKIKGLMRNWMDRIALYFMHVYVFVYEAGGSPLHTINIKAYLPMTTFKLDPQQSAHNHGYQSRKFVRFFSHQNLPWEICKNVKMPGFTKIATVDTKFLIPSIRIDTNDEIPSVLFAS